MNIQLTNKGISLSFSVFFILSFVSINSEYIYGHTFSPNESAEFLVFLDEFDTELLLTSTNLDNIAIAKEHIMKASSIYSQDIQKEISEKNKRVANEILSTLKKVLVINSTSNISEINNTLNTFKDILLEAETSRLDPNAKQNTTIQALHFAGLLDLIEKNYKQVSIPANISESNSQSDTNVSSISSFQTAQILFDKLKSLYDQVLKPSLVSENKTSYFENLDNGLLKLETVISQKQPFTEMTNILHGTLHSELLKAFDLKLKQSNATSSHDMSSMEQKTHGSHKMQK